MKNLVKHSAIWFVVGTGFMALGCMSKHNLSGEAEYEAQEPSERVIDKLRKIVKDPIGGPQGFMLQIENDSTLISFNCEFGHANWVSWTVTASDIGTTKRTKNFYQDTRLPSENCLNPLPTDLSGSGFDRGHMAPSGDRTRDKAYNKGVFSMANIVPQAPQVNQKGWNDLEMLTRDFVKQGNDAIVVSGALGSIGKIPNSGINIPEYTWKVVLIVPKGAIDLSEATTRIYAVLFKNALEIAPVPLADALVSVDELEEKVGIDVLSGIMDDLENRLERKRQELPVKGNARQEQD
jgi:endonuclease G